MPGLDSIMGATGGASPWGVIASAAGGLLNTGIGIAQRAKGRKLLKQLGDSPQERIPNAVLQNQQLATNAANTGIPQEQYNNAMKNIQRQQLMALKGSADRHGVLGSIGAITQAGLDATGNLDARDAAARQQNQRTLYSINNQVGNWQDRVWQNNVNNPYMRKYQYANSLLGIGNQNATTGADQLLGAGALYGGSGGFRSNKTVDNGNWGLTGYPNQRTRQQTI